MDLSPPSRRAFARPSATANRIALLITLLLVVLAAIPIGRTIWAYQDYPFDSDEANHANGGLELALDLRAGDLAAFARDFYNQGFYPPAFSALKAVAFTLFGPSALTARAFSLVCLLAALIVLYLVGRKMDAQHGWLIGLVAVALTLTAQPLLVASGLVMMETPGLLASFVTLGLYLSVLEKPTSGRLAGTSLMLVVTFLTKYTYGLPALATLILMELSLLLPQWRRNAHRDAAHASPRQSAPLHRRWLWLFGPFALAMLLWFAGPGKLAQFWDYATAQPAHKPWNWETVIFYPRSLAFHYTPSPLFALVTLLGIFWAAMRFHRPKLRLFLIYFGVGMGEMFLNFPKDTRFIATFVPAAHVLTGAMLAWGMAAWRAGSLRRGWGLVGLLLVVSGITAVPTLRDRFATYPSVMAVRYETHPQLNNLAAWIQAQIPAGERFYLINFWDQFSHQALAWHLGTHNPPPGARFHQLQMPFALLEEATPENIAALRQEIRASGVRYVVSFEGTPWGAPVWWLYADALGDTLTPVTREIMYVDIYAPGKWLERNLLRQDTWERVKAESQYTLQIQTTVYAVTAQ